jgi:hypothetical protein
LLHPFWFGIYLFIMSVNHPLLDAGHYGHSLCAHIIGTLLAFGFGSLAHEDSGIYSSSYVGFQFDQPLAAVGGVGDMALAPDMVSSPLVAAAYEWVMLLFSLVHRMVCRMFCRIIPCLWTFCLSTIS